MHYCSKMEELGIVGKYWVQARWKPSIANSKFCSSVAKVLLTTTTTTTTSSPTLSHVPAKFAQRNQWINWASWQSLGEGLLYKGVDTPHQTSHTFTSTMGASCSCVDGAPTLVFLELYLLLTPPPGQVQCCQVVGSSRIFRIFCSLLHASMPCVNH